MSKKKTNQTNIDDLVDSIPYEARKCLKALQKDYNDNIEVQVLIKTMFLHGFAEGASYTLSRVQKSLDKNKTINKRPDLN